MTNSPETARYTSVYQRIQAQSQRKNARNRADGSQQLEGRRGQSPGFRVTGSD